MSWLKLENLLCGVEYTELSGSINTYVAGITGDSRKVRPNNMFFALRGTAYDGNTFIPQAISAGASVIVTDNFQQKYDGVTMLIVPDVRIALARCSKNFYGDPSNKLALIGITGTNGKTTVSYLIEHILLNNSVTAGLMGTVENRFADYFCRSWMTTPESTFINYLLNRAVHDGIKAMVMEVSSHGIKQKRIEGLEFDVAVFTNLSHDHLDYHETYDDYCFCKAQLFAAIKKKENACAVINADDSKASYMLASVQSGCLTYGINNTADMTAKNIRCSKDSTKFTLCYSQSIVEVNSPLVGVHNVYNLLAAIGACAVLGISVEKCVQCILCFKGVPGRLERISVQGKPTVYVDYAHTHDALEHILKTIRSVHTGILHVVMGCGGNRDKTKRAPMGRVASAYADAVYITSDNPRSEDPLAIIGDIVKGCENSNYYIIPDRKEAIQTAIGRAQENDVVVIAGKGHEQYQLIGASSFPFDDKKTAQEILCAHEGVVS